MTVPGLIVIKKVRVKNLLSPGPQGWGSRQIKVKFRVGTAAEETLPKRPNADGSVEWTKPIEMHVNDTDANLIATVVTRSGRNGSWSHVQGGLFKGFPVKVLPAFWDQVPTTGPAFHAELETFIDGGGEGAGAVPTSLSSLDSVEEHEGRRYFSPATGDGIHVGARQEPYRHSPTVFGSPAAIAPRPLPGRALPGHGPPGWGPATAAAVVVARPASPLSSPLLYGALPDSTAVAVAEAAAAPATAPASGGQRGGSLFTTPSARPPSSVVQRSSSAGFLTRDGSIPGRSREGSSSSFQLARGSSRSLGQSQGGSSSSHDSGQPPLRSPVGIPSVSRLMDDNFRLEENEAEGADRSSPPEAPSVPAWGGPAFQPADASASAVPPPWRGSAAGPVQLDWRGAAGRADEGQPARPGSVNDRRSAQREEPSIGFSRVHDAGVSPAPGAQPPSTRRKTRSGPFSFWKKVTKKPPGAPIRPSPASSRTGAESGAGDWASRMSRASSAPGGRPTPTSLESRRTYRQPVPAERLGARLEETLDERRGTDATLPSRGLFRGRRRLMGVAPQLGAAAPASEERDFGGTDSPRHMMAQPTTPTAPPLSPQNEGCVHDCNLRVESYSPLETGGSSSLWPPGAAVRPGAGALVDSTDTTGAKSPPPSDEELLAQKAVDSRVHAPAIRGGAHPEEEPALEEEAKEAREEPSTYNHPGALGLRFENGAAWEDEEGYSDMPDSYPARSSPARAPDASEGRALYPEAGMQQGEESLEVIRSIGDGTDGAPPAPSSPRPRPRVHTRSGQPLGRRLGRGGGAQPEEEGEEEAEVEEEADAAMEQQSAYDHPVVLGSWLDSADTGQLEERYSAMTVSSSDRGIALVPTALEGRTFYPEGRTPRDEELLAVKQQLKTAPPAVSAPQRVESVPRAMSVPAESAPQTRAIQPLGGLEARQVRDPVLFSCFSPRSVWGEHEFQLNVLAYLPQLRDEVLQSAMSNREVEAGLPGAMSILRGRRVTVKLELPENLFHILGPEGNGSSQVSHHPPSVRDFVWNGGVEDAGFTVECLPGAAVGIAQCGAKIIEGSSVTRLSFLIEVVEAGESWAYDDMKAELLDTKMEEVEANVAVIDPDELNISGDVIGHGVQGETFKGSYRGQTVAVKRLKRSSAPSSSAPDLFGLRHEATILSLLGHHPNIVEFYGLSRRGGGNGDEGLDVVTKFEAGGNLQEALGIERNGDARTNGGGRRKAGKGREFGGAVRTAWARDMARGLANSHAAGVVHNDVASRNGLRSYAAAGAPVLLCDFGMSRILRGDGVEQASLIDLQGTRNTWPVWQMPKESLSAPYSLSKSSDAWMYGTMLYEMFEGKPPFCGIESKAAQALILEGKTLDTPVLLQDQGLEKVFKSCLQVDWKKRPNMEEVVAKLSY